MRGKHEAESKFSFDFSFEPFLKILAVIAVIAILFGIGFGGYKLVSKIFNKPKQEPAPEIETLISELEGYKVLGKVQIEKAEVDAYILDSYEDAALKIGVGKLSGDRLNKKGNFTIIGHNNDNFFGRLNELDKNDEIVIVNPDLSEVKYRIINIENKDPNELDILLDNDEGTILTLITCENGATDRLVIKAKIEDEIEDSIDNTISNVVENTIEG